MDGLGEGGDSYQDDDLDLLPNETFDNLEREAFASQRPTFKSVSHHAKTNYALKTTSNHASSDYGDFDEEMLDGEILDAQPQHMLLEARTVPAVADKSPQHETVPPKQIDFTSLELTIARLEEEKQQLQASVQQAQAGEYSKIGEVAIVRANSAKVEREFEARAQALHRAHGEESSRQKAEIDRMRAELQRLSTEKTFLEHDVTDTFHRGRPIARKEPPRASPRKRHAGFDDAFANDEPLSPSKLPVRTKISPQPGDKRKRETSGIGPPPATPRPSFLVSLLAHRYPGEASPTVELLSSHDLSGRSVASILTAQVMALNAQSKTKADLALSIIRIWSQCMQERLYAPVHFLIDYIRFIIISDPVEVPPHLTNDLMALLQETADLVVIPRCQKKHPPTDPASITSRQTLALIHLMALQLAGSPDESRRFWRTMRFDFVMMMLSFIHPLEELVLTLQLLGYSILDDSFAMIIPAGDGKQNVSEARVIDNISRFLVESPRVSQGERPLSLEELCSLRMTILSLVESMCGNDYASRALCFHRLFLGRLVRLMNDSLSLAYKNTPTCMELIQLVNEATRILYFLSTRYHHIVDMQQKLSVIPGGEKKYLIILTRLAFSDSNALESDIEDDVVELAHKMLEERVSPEEAEGLVEAMSA